MGAPGILPALSESVLRLECVVLARFEPRLRGLPEGFLDQPFYGWLSAFSGIYSARFSGLWLQPF